MTASEWYDAEVVLGVLFSCFYLRSEKGIFSLSQIPVSFTDTTFLDTLKASKSYQTLTAFRLISVFVHLCFMLSLLLFVLQLCTFELC